MVPLALFHPAVRSWFAEVIGEPTAPQRLAWPAIAAGGHVLLAAPTGSGKTLAAFLHAIDSLVREGPYLADETRVLYVSPLRALSNDVQKNLLGPLAGIAARDAFVPAVRVLVRTGDTSAAERAAMAKRPPHVLVTTPESLGILLCSKAGQRMLGSVRSVIVDEIHAVAGSKRGSHLALSLERLEHLAGRPVQRIGISATQKPLAGIAHLLGGVGRKVNVLDAGHLRQLDLGVIIPDSPLEAVVSHEVWGEIHRKLLDLIRGHRTTLIFVSTRSMAERLSKRLIDLLDEAIANGETVGPAGADGAALLACHHGSLAKERRFAAEDRLKRGELRALVATATLELGIDIGEVDLVVQLGSPRAIATFLQRVGRAGHGPSRIPKARVVAMTPSEVVESAALLRAVRERDLDAIAIPEHPWDVLAQHAVAACCDRPWPVADLHAVLSRAWPYREVDQGMFARVVALHAGGRAALIHYDPATRILRGTKRSKLTVITGGGAIPDTALLQVREDPEDLLVGTVDEDFALESSPGDIFQLGNTSWQILRVDGRSGVVRVRNALGSPPTIPFWFGEAPGRTRELSQAVGRLRADATDAAWIAATCGVDAGIAQAVWDQLEAARRALGELPTHKRLVAERFFDETGNQHLVIHACFGTRINRAWGLALRKRFCTGFGFELEAAATDEGLILSLGPRHSFALEDVFAYLSPATLRSTLVQACITGGQFETRWRWASAIALLVERSRGGKRVPPHLLRIRANDSLVAAFPGALACPDNFMVPSARYAVDPGDAGVAAAPPEDRSSRGSAPAPLTPSRSFAPRTPPAISLVVPEDHPIVAQTVTDLLTDLLDSEGLVRVLTALKKGELTVHAVDTPEPSPLAQALLAARPYAFLDDTPFEERRTRAVAPPGSEPLPPIAEDGLDPVAVAAVVAEAWPDPDDREELHEVLCWIGFVTGGEAARSGWSAWLVELQAAGRAGLDQGRWFASGTSRDEVDLWKGRLDALGPVVDDATPGADADAERPPVGVMLALEQQGLAMRAPIAGVPHWCHRRLFRRILAVSRDRRRIHVEPVSPAAFWRFLAAWQGVTDGRRRAGPAGCLETLHQLAGLELPAGAWAAALRARVADYRPEFLDELTLSGEFAWGRLWSSPEHGVGALRSTPIGFVPRADLAWWLRLAGPASETGLSGPAREMQAALRARGAAFVHELYGAVRQVPATIEDALAELVSAGMTTCDSVAGLRWLLLSGDRRKAARPPAGRWSILRPAGAATETTGRTDEDLALLVARTLLRRSGAVFRKTFERERIRCPWRDVLRALRLMELRGDCVGGRFVAGFTGEQFALPDVARALGRVESGPPLSLPASDPLNYTGLLIPGDRVRAGPEASIRIG